MNLPPGVRPNDPHFDPPDPLGDCVSCDEPVFGGAQLVDDRGRLWHESCAPDAPEEVDQPRPKVKRGWNVVDRRPGEVLDHFTHTVEDAGAYERMTR